MAAAGGESVTGALTGRSVVTGGSGGWDCWVLGDAVLSDFADGASPLGAGVLADADELPEVAASAEADALDDEPDAACVCALSPGPFCAGVFPVPLAGPPTDAAPPVAELAGSTGPVEPESGPDSVAALSLSSAWIAASAAVGSMSAWIPTTVGMPFAA